MGNLRVTVLTFSIYINWAHSLKEKRAEVKRLVARLRHSFNVSCVESGTQDLHQTITIGVAFLAHGNAQEDRTTEHISRFVEANTDGRVLMESRESIQL